MARRISLEGLERIIRSRNWSERDLARVIDAGEGKARAYLNDTWSVVDRKELERMLDALKCELSDLFTISESFFFKPSIDGQEGQLAETWCISLSPNHRDYDSIALLRNFLEANLRMPAITESSGTVLGNNAATEPIVSSKSSLEDLLEIGSCIVLGTPSVNELAESALRLAFGDSIPFQFKDTRPRMHSSPLVESQGDHEFGIFVPILNSCFASDVVQSSHEDFKNMSLHKKKDVGVLVSVNVRSRSGAIRKLVILAGITRIGTQAAAAALAARFRELDTASDQALWGIVEGSYDKPPQSSDRLYRGYRWLYPDKSLLMPKKKIATSETGESSIKNKLA